MDKIITERVTPQELEELEKQYYENRKVNWSLKELKVGERRTFMKDQKKTLTKLKYAVYSYSRTSGRKFSVIDNGNEMTVVRIEEQQWGRLNHQEGLISTAEPKIREVIKMTEDQTLMKNLADFEKTGVLDGFLITQKTTPEGFKAMTEEQKLVWAQKHKEFIL